MEFTVKFEGTGGYAAYKEGETGYAGVKLIRETLGVPDLDLSLIHGQKHHIQKDVTVVVPEELVAKSELFYGYNSCLVYVRSRFLNKFIVEEVNFTQNPKTAEIESAWIEYKIDEPRLLKAWGDAGFPTEWGI